MAKPSRRKMKSGIRAIVEWAAEHGWTLQDGKDGTGHWVLRHPESDPVRLPDTPGDRRGIANAKAEIRRKSGLPSESGPAARYRHEGHRERFDMDAAVREARLRRAHEEVEALRRGRLQVQIAETRLALEKVNPRRDPDLARELAARLVRLKKELNSP
jgi:hypothetical protein